jgi:hypothetical protein
MLVIKERTTGTVSFTLKNEADVAISLSAILTAAVTMKDVASDTVVNGWDERDILNANGVTIDANGTVTWPLEQLDTALVVPTSTNEIRRVLVDFTYTAGALTKRHYDDFEILIEAEPWVP